MLKGDEAKRERERGEGDVAREREEGTLEGRARREGGRKRMRGKLGETSSEIGVSN